MRSARSTISRARRARSIRSSLGTPAYTSGSSTLWSALARGRRLNVWNTKPISRFLTSASSSSFICETSLPRST
jgi:hypothetical protein